MNGNNPACVDNVSDVRQCRVKVFIRDTLSNGFDERADTRVRVELDTVPYQEFLEAHLKYLAAQPNRSDKTPLVETDAYLVNGLEEIVSIHFVERKKASIGISAFLRPKGVS